ncbi:hypothetical protein E2V04_13965 [Salmonella enterica]|nr:hypothetical protein [Salmonella enterica]EDT6042039.1 hypothetical protein [Salmonella enterica subsp. enterica serovar Gaminara]ELJ2696411.1 hypothetical protein [Salmonella enterica subsp. enterica]ELJ2720604.1 hypothetical protein [Salmonella enterica subsp. diarizonae]EAU0198772.1 hypothetical protein [Salmonella enterica]
MTTITKERIELFVKSPLENGLTRGEQMELARIALAALESEPVAYIFKHPAGELFWSLTDESNKGQNDVMPVYTAPPARDNKQTDELVMWVKRLAHSLRNARPNSKLHDAAMDYLSRKGLISVEDVLR